MDADSPEYQRQVIDAQTSAQIGSLEESIRTLRLHRNTLAPVSSLPTEIIATIFSILRSHVTLPASEPDSLAWLRVAHVCHQWREIALNQPLFWRHVDFTTVSSAGAAEMLARAKTVPLRLEASVPSGHWDNARFSAFQKELQAHVSRICHLSIFAEFCHLQTIFEELVSPAPILEYLSLYGVVSRFGTSGASVKEAFVPDTLFDGSTPRLSRLKLRGCDINWNSPLLRNLKHLEISPWSSRRSFSVWLDALDEMPQLETLVLYWSSESPIPPPGASLSPDIDRTVTLPSLTLFQIFSYARNCGLVLAHLILPALTSLCIISDSCHTDWSDVREILPYVSRHARGPHDAPPLQSLDIENGLTHADILAWTQPDTDVGFPNRINFFDVMDSARVAFTVTSEDKFFVTDRGVFDAMMETLPLEGLMTLTAYWQERTGPQFWLRYAPKWPLLWLVRLRPFADQPFAAHEFCEALLEDNGGRESPLLPSLTKLVLVDTILTVCVTLSLCDALMKRAEQGVPLEILDLRTCHATTRTVELLSEIVVDVLGPEETLESEEQVISVSCGTFVGVESDYSHRVED